MQQFVCPKCGESFTSAMRLGHHVDLEHVRRPEQDIWECWCGLVFERGRLLGEHVSQITNLQQHVVLGTLADLA
jgi:hypothetical protein